MSRALAEVSFRDPAGFVNTHAGDLRRQINLVYREHYDRLMNSGLYDELVDARLLIRHEEIEAEGWEPDRAYKVIRPEPVAFISYPYEWCFSAYRDAALALLEIQRRAIEHGMTLKDEPAPVQHPVPPGPTGLHRHAVVRDPARGGALGRLPAVLRALPRPAGADVARGPPGRGPLPLQHRRHPARPGRPDVACPVLAELGADAAPPAARAVPADPHRNALHGEVESRGRAAVSKNALLGLVDSLKSTIEGLRWKPSRGGWASYEEALPYSAEGFEHKVRIVRELLEKARPRTVWDLGANAGHFSRIAAESGASTIAFDFDAACIEKAYLDARARDETRLLPLVLDLFNPSPASGWMNLERGSIFERGRPEMVVALALIHHIALVGNQPMENLAEFFRGLAPWLLIEFVPESDPQVRLLAEQRAGVHHEYTRETFEQCFGKHFLIVTSEPVTERGRILYLLRRRGD